MAKHPDFLSLQQYVNRINELHSLFQTAVECYRAAIAAISASAPGAPKHLSEDLRGFLRKLGSQIGSEPSQSTLEEAQGRLEEALRLHGKKLELHIRQQEREVKEIMAIVAAMAESMAAREKHYNVRFRGIAKKMRILTTSSDLAEIREKLAEEIVQLEQYVDDMAKDTQAALARVQEDLNAPRKHREEPVPDHDVDPVTSLPGRHSACTVLEEKVRTGTAFAVAGFAIGDLNRLSAQHGEQAVRAVLGEFAHRLRQCTGAMDYLARWNEDTFLVAADCTMSELLKRALKWEQELEGMYALEVSKRMLSVPVHCSFNVAGNMRGETAGQLVERLDVLFCHDRQPVAR